MFDSWEGALGAAGVLNGAGEGLGVAEAVAPPVWTHALVLVLAGVPH